MIHSHLALGAEFLLLFAVIPLILRYLPWPIPPLPVLWVATGYCFAQIERDSSFPKRELWNAAAVLPAMPQVLTLFLVLGTLITLAVWRFSRTSFLDLVLARPRLWLLVMFFYPLLSVYPQSIIYRAFLMHRYTPLFPNPGAMILASASAFAFMHILFRNPIAPAMTFVGGLLFAWRFQTTHSLLLASIEHALYGCLLFTVGLGQYFYGGTLRSREQLVGKARAQRF